ncbi:MAG: two-component regulator propeller domain-containing protein, partial [candidate division WOR-3 bacterium]
MSKIIKKLLLIIILIQFIHSYAYRPRIEFTHLRVQDGLSQSWVKSIYQDKYGFMWFGTNEGLNKYDGYNFTVYRNNPEDQNTISNNGISSIYEDKKGDLWIGTENGVNLYDRNKDRFVYIYSLSHKVIVDFLELENGEIFM